MKARFLLVLCIILVCSPIFAKTTITPIEQGNGLNSIQLMSTDVIPDDLNDQKAYAVSIGFTPAGEETPAMCQIILACNNNGALEYVSFDDSMGVEFLWLTTSDDVFEGTFPKLLLPIIGPDNTLSISGADYNYLIEILKRNSGNTTMFFDSGYTVELDYDTVYFETLLYQCVLANTLGVDFYDTEFAGYTTAE